MIFDVHILSTFFVICFYTMLAAPIKNLFLDINYVDLLVIIFIYKSDFPFISILTHDDTRFSVSELTVAFLISFDEGTVVFGWNWARSHHIDCLHLTTLPFLTFYFVKTAESIRILIFLMERHVNYIIFLAQIAGAWHFFTQVLMKWTKHCWSSVFFYQPWVILFIRSRPFIYV